MMKVAEWKTFVKEKADYTGFAWRVLRFGKVVASGEESSYEKAELSADRELAKLVIGPAKTAGKKYMLSQLLAQYAGPRPNLVLYVFQCLAMPEDVRNREECLNAAAEQEQSIADRTREEWRVKPPTHGRALEANVVAARIWDAAVAAGYVGPKAAAKGEALFSYWWHEQDCEPGIWTKDGGTWNCRPLKHLEEVYAAMQKPAKSKPSKAVARA